MITFRRFVLTLLLLSLTLSGCGSAATPSQVPVQETEPAPPAARPAFETGIYPNLFADYLGKSEQEVQEKLDAAWQQLFFGDERSERVYYPVGADMAYMLDTGNDDVRSEGMSYGMMIAVQLDQKEVFDRLWKWTKTYMHQKDGGYKGYFAWHAKPDGTQLAANPASDGEAWFIMALLFADGRWGSGEGIYNYRAEAQAIMDVALHADQLSGNLATNLFDPETKQIVFVPQLGKNSQFTDPSYHVPHYYELWARWADKDNDFWAEAVQASREYLKTAVHPQTGLAPNYSYFDGQPHEDDYHGKFRYDAFRVGMNVGVDHVWFRPGPWHVEQSNRLLDFFASEGINNYKAEYTLDGKPLVTHRSSGLIATNAVAALAADPEKGRPFVQALWDQDVPTGKYRYYDGLLMMMGLLQVSGNFRIYEPGAAPEGRTVATAIPEVRGALVPPAGRVLLLVGQDVESIDAYFDATVTAPGGVAIDTSLQPDSLDQLASLAQKYPKSSLSVGLNLEEITAAAAAGPSNPAIDAFLDGLVGFERPVFLRLGYGFDGSANEQASQAYVAAWNVFHERIQARAIANVALVWEPASCEESNLAAWYPGDELVDWIGMPYCNEPSSEGMPPAVLQFAREHSKPLMVSAVPVQTNAAWDAWYAPFFQFVSDHNDVVRAVTYINHADDRIDSDPERLKLWKEETKQARWLRGGPGLFELLSK